MNLKLPDFFQGLKGQVVSVEIGERNSGSLLLGPAHLPEVHAGATMFCREIGLQLDLRLLGEIEPPDGESCFTPREYESVAVESIAVFAATTLLSRSSKNPLVLRAVELRAYGVTIKMLVSPFGQQSGRMLIAQVEQEYGSEVVAQLKSEIEDEVDLLGGQYAIGKLKESNVEGLVYRAFHSAASNYAHSVISSVSVDLTADAVAISPDATPADAELAVAVVFALALRLYFFGEQS